MPYLFSLILFVAIVLLLLSLASPSAGLFWYKKTKSRGTAFKIYGIAIFVCFIGIGATVPKETNENKPAAQQDTKETTAEPVAAVEQPVKLTLEDSIKQIKEDWSAKYMSAWDGSCRPVEKYIKDNMNDPDSYEHIETYFGYLSAKNYFTVKTKYRGKNAYGAKVIGEANAIVSADGEVLELTNQ